MWGQDDDSDVATDAATSAPEDVTPEDSAPEDTVPEDTGEVDAAKYRGGAAAQGM